MGGAQGEGRSGGGGGVLVRYDTEISVSYRWLDVLGITLSRYTGGAVRCGTDVGVAVAAYIAYLLPGSSVLGEVVNSLGAWCTFTAGNFSVKGFGCRLLHFGCWA